MSAKITLLCEIEDNPLEKVGKRAKMRRFVILARLNCDVAVHSLRGFRTQAGADQYACFHSILETAKRNGASKFGTLYQLMIEDNPDSSFIETITS